MSKNPSTTNATSSTSIQIKVKPLVIGLYGVPGSGKTTTLNDLSDQLKTEKYMFFEGSEVLSKLHDQGLDGFKRLFATEKASMRSQAIRKIEKACRDAGKVGIVTGHLAFWPDIAESVHTEDDWDVYTHIIYLNVSADEIERRVEQDQARKREEIAAKALAIWQDTEMKIFRKNCLEHGIQFTPLSGRFTEVKHLVMDIVNSTSALARADGIVDLHPGKLKTMFVIDGDKTLAAEDTGTLMWQTETRANGPDSLKKIFEKSGYKYGAFYQAALLHQQLGSDADFENKCEGVANQVIVRPEFVKLLKHVQTHTETGVIIVTSGLQRVWKRILAKHQLPMDQVVVGASRDASLIVTPETKRDIIAHLKAKHDLRVWAFGDSPIDIPMLCEADYAIVATGDELSRSKSMESALEEAIGGGTLVRPRQVLFSTSVPRLDKKRLPIIRLDDIQALSGGINFDYATEKSASKLLTGPTRDAKISGNALREAHRRVGYYLSTEYLGEKIGLEEYEIEHVQGNKTKAHRLLDEKKTLVVPLIRGGEPMAFGVADAFPLAAFHHAKKPKHITYDHIKNMATVILVDGVVNSGASAAEFVEHIRKLHPTIRIVIVAGVVQKEATAEGSLLQKAVARHGKISLVALRQSDNKFTGKGGTDTGHRLFNTTYSDD